MRCFLSHFAVVLAVILFAEDGRTQNKLDQPSLAQMEAYITNDGNTTVLFYLSANEEDWDEYTLAPGAGSTYTGDGKLVIRINTINGPRVQYRLEYKKRYKIYWNTSRSCWDVAEISSR